MKPYNTHEWYVKSAWLGSSVYYCLKCKLHKETIFRPYFDEHYFVTSKNNIKKHIWYSSCPTCDEIKYMLDILE